MSQVKLFINQIPSVVKISARRNLGIFSVVQQKATDPIQQLFVDKLREYKSKSGGKLLEPTPEIQKELKQELSKLAKQYGGSESADMTKFPDLKFPEVKLDPINME